MKELDAIQRLIGEPDHVRRLREEFEKTEKLLREQQSNQIAQILGSFKPPQLPAIHELAGIPKAQWDFAEGMMKQFTSIQHPFLNSFLTDLRPQPAVADMIKQFSPSADVLEQVRQFIAPDERVTELIRSFTRPTIDKSLPLIADALRDSVRTATQTAWGPGDRAVPSAESVRAAVERALNDAASAPPERQAEALIHSVNASPRGQRPMVLYVLLFLYWVLQTAGVGEIQHYTTKAMAPVRRRVDMVFRELTKILADNRNDPDVRYVRRSYVDVRIHPRRSDSRIVGILHYADVVEVIRAKRGWTMIRFAHGEVRIEGWVMTRSLQRIEMPMDAPSSFSSRRLFVHHE